MQLNVSVHFTDLWCMIPNESRDEPYLWTFFLKLDGDTIRQPKGGGFLGAVQVWTSPGSQGNLSATDIGSGSHISIPDSIGSFTTTLRPLQLVLAGQTVRIPAQLVAVAVLLEEDDSPGDGVENGHQSLRQFIEDEVNDFITNFDVSGVLAKAGERAATEGGHTLDYVEPVVKKELDDLTQRIRDQAESVVMLDILAAHTPGAIWEFLDTDDMIDAKTFRLDERELLTDPSKGLLFAQLTSTKDGHVKSLYNILGNASVTIHASPTDLSQTGTALGRTLAEEGSYTFTETELCIEPGQRVDWQRYDQQEEERFIFQYPFLPVTWSIDGKPLNGDRGALHLETECGFPFFDPNHPSGPSYRQEKREVVITWEKFDSEGLPGLRLRNRPEDGSYTVTLAVEGSLGTTTHPVATVMVAFDGQAVESPFYAAYNECVERIRSVGERYAKSKRVTPKDLWGPTERQRWYEEQMVLGEQLVRAGMLSLARMEAARQVMRRQLRLPG